MTTVHTPLALRETRRLLLITLVARLLLFILGGLLAMGPWPNLSRVLLVQVAPTVFVTIMVATPWLERLLGPWWLGAVLLLDGLNMSLQGARVLFSARSIDTWAFGATTATARQFLTAVPAEPFMFILIPLLLLAWAYGRRGALVGSAWGTLIHLGTGLLLLGPEAYTHKNLQLLAAVRVAILYVGPVMIAVLAERERRQLSELEAAQARLQRHAATVEQLAISRERNRLARDLHDILAHSLSALVIQLEALRALQVHAPEKADAALAEALQLARSGLHESRQAIQALRADPVVALGLTGTLRSDLQAFQTRTGVAATLTVAGQEPELTEEEALQLYRIADEALANAENHADARHVTVRLESGNDRLDLVIADDGIGFQTDTIGEDRYGLVGMRERAALIGASLQVESRPGVGTEIRCTLKR